MSLSSLSLVSSSIVALRDSSSLVLSVLFSPSSSLNWFDESSLTFRGVKVPSLGPTSFGLELKLSWTLWGLTVTAKWFCFPSWSFFCNEFQSVPPLYVESWSFASDCFDWTSCQDNPWGLKVMMICDWKPNSLESCTFEVYYQNNLVCLVIYRWWRNESSLTNVKYIIVDVTRDIYNKFMIYGSHRVKR